MKNPSRILIFTIFIFSISYFSVVLAADTLLVPRISIMPSRYYPFDEVLYLEGKAASQEVVQIRLYKPGVKPLEFIVKSDAGGEWILAEKVSLEPGDWEARARILKDQNTVSEWSNPRVFKAMMTGITVGGINIKFGTLSLIILALLILGVGLLWYFNLRIHQLKAVIISKEIGEAQESVREGFSELRQDALEELRLLESSGRPLSSDELSRKEHLLRELDRIERNMEREIQDIEKNV